MRGWLTALTMTGVLLAGTLAHAQEVEQRYPIEPGRVMGVPLSLLAPASLKLPCDRLRSEQYMEAAVLFEKQLARNPNDLLAFVGRMQARPSVWGKELRRLEVDARGEKATASAKFRLGVVRFYRWGAEPMPKEPGAPPTDVPGRDLIRAAWQTDKSPIIGLMLAETYPRAPSQEVWREVESQLIRSLAGAEAFAKMQQCEQAGWAGPVPPVGLVASEQRQPLLAVLRTGVRVATVRVMRKDKQGNETVYVWDPVPPERVSKAKYLAAWAKALEAELPADLPK